MDHLKALGIKFIVISIAVFSVLAIFYNATLINLFWTSVLITGITYLIGDLFILRRYGNVIATIADFPLAFLSLWIGGTIFIESGVPIVQASLFAAVFITLVEPFIHSFMINHPVETREETQATNQLQTEFADEIEPHVDTAKKDHLDK